jgi:uncharacterized protein (DUF305 family)
VADERTDVWFLQHLVPHLGQTAVVVSLTGGRLTDPGLRRLAGTIARQSQADTGRLLGWPDQRGLSPNGHSYQPVDRRRRTDLERLSRLRGRALARVMTARLRAGGRLAAMEARDGGLSEVRELARRMLATQQGQARRLRSWRRAQLAGTVTTTPSRRARSAAKTAR